MKTELRPTPESDDAARKGAYLTHGEYPETCGKQIVHIDFARKLESERDSAKTLNRTLLDQLEAKDAQIEAMREAIKEAAHTMGNLIIAKRGGMQPANALIDATLHAKATLAKLQPFLKP